MTAFNDPSALSERSALPTPADLPASLPRFVALKSCRLLALPALAALIWAVPAAVHHHAALRQVRRGLQEFRGETPGSSGPNQAMNSALIVRGQIVMRRVPQISADQEALLLGILSGPADDMAQSEALDVLGIAERMNALSPAQKKDGSKATLELLRRSPGPMVRLESARLLGHLGGASALPALLALQADSDPKVQQAAKRALAQIKR